MITHIVSDWLFSPCCVEHQDEFIFERVAVAYSRDYNEVGRAQIKLSRKRDDAVIPTVTLSVAMETSGRIWPNFELIQALMHVLITMSSLPGNMKRIQSKIAKKM